MQLTYEAYIWLQSSQRRVPLSLIVYGRYRWNMVSDSLESTSWWNIHLCQKSVLSQIVFPRSNHTETSCNTKPSSSTFDRSHKHSLLCYLQPKHVYFKFGTKKPFLWTRILEHYSGILILTAFMLANLWLWLFIRVLCVWKLIGLDYSNGSLHRDFPQFIG